MYIRQQQALHRHDKKGIHRYHFARAFHKTEPSEQSSGLVDAGSIIPERSINILM
jgi:hypothetical protein